MSWSLSLGTISHTAVRSVAQEKADEYFGTNPQLDSAEVREQVDAAVQAAEHLVDAVGYGKPSGEITVSLSGHANPGHEPADGYANDCVTVSVASASPKPERAQG